MKRMLLIVLVVFTSLASAPGQSPEQQKATIAYLQSLQSNDGGFLPSQASPTGATQPASSLRATSSALRALKYCGGEPRDRAAHVKFVEKCHDKASGGFADRPGGKPDVAATAIGIMAVVELKMPTEPYAASVLKYLGENAQSFEDIRIAVAGCEALGKLPPQAKEWTDQVKKTGNADGTFGKGDGHARDTGGAVVALLRMGVEPQSADGVVKALQAGQRKDGAFGKEGTAGSDLETTYRVMRAFKMLKQKPADAERCREFVAKCRNNDGGYGVTPGQPSNVSATYFASIILHWLAEK